MGIYYNELNNLKTLSLEFFKIPEENIFLKKNEMVYIIGHESGKIFCDKEQLLLTYNKNTNKIKIKTIEEIDTNEDKLIKYYNKINNINKNDFYLFFEGYSENENNLILSKIYNIYPLFVNKIISTHINQFVILGDAIIYI